MEAYQAVLLAVVALLVGVLIPVLFQLALTLRAVRAAVAQAGPALASITATAERVERLTAKFEEGGRIEHALAAMDSASSAAAKLQETARLASTIGAALIPAAAAAVKAWRDGREPDEPRSSGEAASQPPPAVRVAP